LWLDDVDLHVVLSGGARFPRTNEDEFENVTTAPGDAKLDHPPTGGA